MEKLEAAKLATQLTIALLQDRNGQFGNVVRSIGRSEKADKTDVAIVFDYLLDHVQSRLNEQ